MTGVWAVVVCGGKGERMGGAINKALLPVGGVPAVVRVVRAFRACGASVALVVRPAERACFIETLALFSERADLYADAGADRQQSVYHGLTALPNDADIVLVHDGARALITQALIRRVIDSVHQYGSGVAALPVTDTVKFADANDRILYTPDRNALRAVQTPQGFRYRELLDAHKIAARETGDSSEASSESAETASSPFVHFPAVDSAQAALSEHEFTAPCVPATMFDSAQAALSEYEFTSPRVPATAVESAQTASAEHELAALRVPATAVDNAQTASSEREFPASRVPAPAVDNAQAASSEHEFTAPRVPATAVDSTQTALSEHEFAAPRASALAVNSAQTSLSEHEFPVPRIPAPAVDSIQEASLEHEFPAPRVSGRATDDAALMEALGYEVRLVEGDRRNLKLTTPEDIRMAEAFLGVQTRVGFGYDAHRLVIGRKLILGGAEIPFEKGLLGHSDADVALHALIDAMLGAAALGDIGSHFPDSDERYRGVSSLTLLQGTDAILRSHGFSVESVDLTIVAERPKLSPLIGIMRSNIASALHLPLGTVSVKATTTEGMGFEGRGEGISAHAVAVVTQRSGVL